MKVIRLLGLFHQPFDFIFIPKYVIQGEYIYIKQANEIIGNSGILGCERHLLAFLIKLT